VSDRNIHAGFPLDAGEHAGPTLDAAQSTLGSLDQRPRRYELARRLDRTQAFAALFGEPAEPVRLGRYELRRHVGGGGMGEVYAAWDPGAEREVAIKIVRPERAASRAEAGLLREAKLLAKLSHPNVVPLYEVDQVDGRVFLVMELVQGQSLRMWLQRLEDKLDGRDRQREALRQYVAAGRGLQAAHAAGLVHRDFKPDNVLVGDDGRVRVVDFGLARPADELDAPAPGARAISVKELAQGETLSVDGRPAAAHPRPARREWVTTRGKIQGTLRYMPPEQMRGEDTDHRSDQFSFCVSLYEALCRRMPFSGPDLPRLQQSVERGAIVAPARGSELPAPLRKAILRGLSANPADRFPDMGALLAVLEAWLQPPRRTAAMAVGLALVVVGGLSWRIATCTTNPCDQARAELDALWTEARRSSIGDAFSRTGLSYARASWSTLEQRLERYVERLGGEIQATCEATHEQEVQSRELHELRMLCLSGRERRLEALLAQLEGADAAVVENAHVAAAALPDLAACQHVETLRYGMRPPAAEVAEAVQEIREHLAQARTQEHLGKSDEALRLARAQLERARAVAYGPAHAEALYQAGRVLAFRSTSEERAEGEQMLRQAASLAESERHDELVAEIWNFLVLSTDENHSSTGQARQWHERAVAAIHRIGDPALQRAAALRNLGRIHLKDGEHAEAEEQQHQALAVLESAPEASRLTHGLYLHDLAVIVQRRGRYQEAQELYDRALALRIAELGETHPHVASVRYSIAMLHMLRGELPAARELLDTMLRVHAETSSETHPLVGKVHLELAELDRQSGALDRAQEHALRALAMLERAYGAGHAKLAPAYTRLGAIEFRRGAHAQALAAFETALALDTRHLGADSIDAGADQMNVAEAQVALGQHEQALIALDHAERVLQSYLSDEPMLGPFLASVRGRALLGRGQLDAAVTTLERAVQGMKALPGEAMLVERADAFWALAQALSASSRENDPRAVVLARDALAIYERQGPQVHTPKDAVRRWLDARDRR
jgi:serine/threonine protein kinase/tetratricopeptide (TPR) repeat protein